MNIKNNIPKSALVYIITGLLMVTLVPVLSRYLPIPDAVKGFITGMGHALEFIAIVKIQRSRKESRCSF